MKKRRDRFRSESYDALEEHNGTRVGWHRWTFEAPELILGLVGDWKADPEFAAVIHVFRSLRAEGCHLFEPCPS